jgi:hypothetical protein
MTIKYNAGDKVVRDAWFAWEKIPQVPERSLSSFAAGFNAARHNDVDTYKQLLDAREEVRRLEPLLDCKCIGCERLG